MSLEFSEKYGYDFGEDVLDLAYFTYNSAIDQDIYNVASLIVYARKNNTHYNNHDIAKALVLDKNYIELIQYILAGVKRFKAFTYGTSPRGLFVDNLEEAQEFLNVFEDHYLLEWGINIHESTQFITQER
jgi:hypothetical protein